METVVSIFQGIAILIGIFVLYLLVVALIPGPTVPEQHLEKAKEHTRETNPKPCRSRKDVSFEVKGMSLSAWLYLPENVSTPLPCIIMGHGFGGIKDMGLEPYAIRYQEAGFAVLAFDYRHFGESDGEPRQLVWIPYQLEDWLAAITYARGLKEIDPARIALWGTSMSGGHVIVTAAKDKNIACVSAQCPGLDGHASGEMISKREGIGYILRMIMHGQRDLVRSWLGLSPHKIPIVGKPGSIACLTTPDAYDAFGKLAPENFINEVCARIILRANKYRPVKHAQNVRCPVLLPICDNDNLTPISAAEETERNLGKYAEVKHYPIGHFDIYIGDNFERSVSDQLGFFEKHL
ncbi:MAG: alpha/beta fold hydrolase [Proteobacteria bacterium]|nr:alpha/beta fold hydrolase [Pseudomonadota bacterium]NIS68076.1 alpha/beta fold hydrolase [Pseudomonadota bacterium]